MSTPALLRSKPAPPAEAPERAALRLHRMGSLLGRWHQWRKHYSPQRGFFRPAGRAADRDPDDELEAMLMQTIERAIDELPAAEQIALQHIARAECLGVEITSSQLPASKADRENLYANAMRTLEIRLIRVGLL